MSSRRSSGRGCSAVSTRLRWTAAASSGAGSSTIAADASPLPSPSSRWCGRLAESLEVRNPLEVLALGDKALARERPQPFESHLLLARREGDLGLVNEEHPARDLVGRHASAKVLANVVLAHRLAGLRGGANDDGLAQR